MKSSIEWQDDGLNASLEERATVADLTLELGLLNVTKHLNEEALSDHVTVALYGVAHGIAHDWWTIFGARESETSLLKYRNGYLLPDIRFRFDGAAFEVNAHQKIYAGPDVRFFGGTGQVYSRRDGEALLAELVEQILARLEAQGLKQTSAALRWKRVQHSRQSHEAEFCEAAGALGLDPYQIDDQPAAFIEAAENHFEHEPLVEFVAGADNVDQPKLVSWVETMSRHQGFRYRLANLHDVAKSVAGATVLRSGEPAWAAAYRAARATRKALNLGQTDRLGSFIDVAKVFGAGKAYNLAPSVDGIRALRREHTNGTHIHVRNHGDSSEAQASHLFTLARGIGDAVCFTDTELAPINGLHRASRQAVGRAFAAEFLAPVEEIRSMVRDKKDVVTIADEFAVSSLVIERQLENAQRIEGACLAN